MKVCLKLFGILALLISAMLILFDLENSKKKANDIAVKYLESVYIEQMKSIKVRLSYIDPSMYHVYFTPESNPNLTFEVLIMLDFRLPTKNKPDNYLLKYFEFYFVKNIQSIIEELNLEGIATRIIILDQPLYSFKVPEDLKEGMTYKEMEPHIDYDLCFDINKMWKKLDKDIAARKILDIIEYLQESGFSPNKIRFLYKEETSVAFSEWNNINDVSQISKLLE